MSLDPKTIVIMNIISTLLMGFSLFVVSRGHLGKIKGLTKWGYAALIQSLGWIFVGALRGAVPDIFSIVIGNSLLLLSFGLYFIILAEFNNQVVRSYWVYLVDYQKVL